MDRTTLSQLTGTSRVKLLRFGIANAPAGDASKPRSSGTRRRADSGDRRPDSGIARERGSRGKNLSLGFSEGGRRRQLQRNALALGARLTGIMFIRQRQRLFWRRLLPPRHASAFRADSGTIIRVTPSEAVQSNPYC